MNVTKRGERPKPHTYREVQYSEEVYCPKCGTEAVIGKGDLQYHTHSDDVGGSDSWLTFPSCPECGKGFFNKYGGECVTLYGESYRLVLQHHENIRALKFLGVIFCFFVCVLLGLIAATQ